VERKTEIDARVNTHRGLLKLAFAELRKQGFVARMNFACCGSCASYEIGVWLEERGRNPDEADAVYWHRQSDDAFNKHGILTVGHLDQDTGRPQSLYVHHSGRTQLAVDTINSYGDFGIQAYWDGDTNRCIEVTPKIWCAYCGRGAFGVEPNPGAWGRLVLPTAPTEQVGWVCPSWHCTRSNRVHRLENDDGWHVYAIIPGWMPKLLVQKP
jgi:hypothetical protein